MKFSERYSTHHYPDDPVKSALWDYVAGYTSDVNNKLRKGQYRLVKDICSLLDIAFTERQILDVWRTVDLDYLKNVYGVNLTDEKSVRRFVSQHPKLTNKGYMSTASVKESPWMQGWWDSEILIHITSDFPYPCIDINKVFKADEIDCADQHEILLPRDTTLQITGYSHIPEYNVWVLEAKILNVLNEGENPYYKRSGNITCVKDLLDNRIISQYEYDKIAMMLSKFEKQLIMAIDNNEITIRDIPEILYTPLPKIVDYCGLPVDISPYNNAFDEIQQIIDIDIERILYNNIDVDYQNQEQTGW